MKDISKLLIVVVIAIIIIAGTAGYLLVQPPTPLHTNSPTTTTTYPPACCTMTTTTTRTSSIQSPFITNGENFLIGQYNKSIGLLPEYSGAQNYWLYSDNYLAIQAFKNGTSSNATNQLQIEQNVSETLQRYMNAIPDAKNQYMALTQIISSSTLPKTMWLRLLMGRTSVSP